jgi:hypothetical protein
VTHLAEFIKFGIENHADNHFMIVLWGHGRGWDDDSCIEVDKNKCKSKIRLRCVPRRIPSSSLSDYASGEGSRYGFLSDNNPPDFLTNRELQKALKDATECLKKKTNGKKSKIDILCIDACLMGMAEVSHQVREFADFLVSSEETIPNESLPYDSILDKLVRNPAMEPRDLEPIRKLEMRRSK